MPDGRDAADNRVSGGRRPQAPTGPKLPSVADWPRKGAGELSYRAQKLAEIQRRIEADGPHKARPDASRARQFMPFAALKGYHELAHEQESRFEE